MIWLADTIYSYITSGDIVLENGSIDSNAKSYEFVDGKLYKLAVFNDNGTINEEKSIPSTVTFSKNTGTGLTEDSLIVLNNPNELLSINSPDVINSGATYFKLNTGFTIKDILPISGRSETVIDLNGNQFNIEVKDNQNRTTTIWFQNRIAWRFFESYI